MSNIFDEDEIDKKRKQILIVFVVGLSILFSGGFFGHPMLAVALGITFIFFGIIFIAGSNSPEGGLWAISRFFGWSIQGLGFIGLLLLDGAKGSWISILSFSIIPLSLIILPIIFFKLTKSKQEKIQSQVQKRKLQLNDEDLEFIDEIIYKLHDQIKSIENQRIFNLPIIIFTILLFNSPFIFWTYSVIQAKNGIVSFVIIGSIFVFFATLGAMKATRKYAMKNYTQSFKGKLVFCIIQCLGNSILKYIPNNYIEESYLNRSNLFGYFNKYTGDDLIIGQVNNLIFECSEIHVSNKSSDDESRVFDGLFFVIDIPQRVQTPLGTNFKFGRKILLDNPEFNELFSVFGNDDTEAFYILSSKVLEKMVEYVYKTGQSFQFSFIQNKLYIAIPASPLKQFFEPPIFRSLWNYKVYAEIITDFKFIFELLNTLEFRKAG